MVGSFHESSSSASWHAAMFCPVSRHHAHHQFMLWGCQPVQFCWSWPMITCVPPYMIQSKSQIGLEHCFPIFHRRSITHFKTNPHQSTKMGNWMSECFLHNGSSWRIFIWSFETQHITQQMSSGFLTISDEKNSLRSRVGQQRNWLLIQEGMTSQSSWVGMTSYSYAWW